ncbi:MAG: hypothetical protein FWD66_01090 [Paludibacter sp.]|nr:hypothetical protein [Paludibacter sp.]
MKKSILFLILAVFFVACKNDEPRPLTIEQRIENEIRKNLKDTIYSWGEEWSYENIKIKSCNRVDFMIDNISDYSFYKYCVSIYYLMLEDNFIFNETEYFNEYYSYTHMQPTEFLNFVQVNFDDNNMRVQNIEDTYTPVNYYVKYEYNMKITYNKITFTHFIEREDIYSNIAKFIATQKLSDFL